MSKHQYAMVMDLNKCLGCQTCTIACKKLWTDRDGTGYMYWNNVETRPGLGYPRQWDRIGGGWKDGALQPSPLPTMDDYGHAWEYNYEQRLYEGKKQPVMPSPEPHSGVNWDEDVGSLNADENYFFYLPRICNHCTYPACLEACPRKAIYKRDEDGIVVIDQDRCQGYRYCIKACPYKKIYFNEVTGKSEKCIFCYPRLEKGQVNACAAQCPGRLRFVGLLDDPESPCFTSSPLSTKLLCPCSLRKGPSPTSSRRRPTAERELIRQKHSGRFPAAARLLALSIWSGSECYCKFVWSSGRLNFSGMPIRQGRRRKAAAARLGQWRCGPGRAASKSSVTAGRIRFISCRSHP